MKEMWEETVAPAIRAALPGPRCVIRHRCVKCFGVGESHVEQMLPDLIRRGRTPSVGITVHQATITLRITAEGASDEECDELTRPTLETIRTCLGDLVFGEEDEELQHVVARRLAERGTTLSVAEWGTGGLIQHWLHEACGNRPEFVGGLVTTSRDSCIRALRVSSEILDRHGENSREAAAAMAEHCREVFGSDLALAMGSFPQVDPQAATPPPAWFALATREEVFPERAPFAGHPEILEPLMAKRALNLVRLYLSK
jgi:nicotinamide-nucleotide amidase